MAPTTHLRHKQTAPHKSNRTHTASEKLTSNVVVGLTQVTETRAMREFYTNDDEKTLLTPLCALLLAAACCRCSRMMTIDFDDDDDDCVGAAEKDV